MIYEFPKDDSPIIKVIGVGGGGSYDNSIACYWSSDTNKFSFLQGNGGSNPVNIVQSTTSPAGAWYHYAVSKDSSNFIRKQY